MSFSGGSVNVGTGEVYETLKDLADDMGTITSDILVDLTSSHNTGYVDFTTIDFGGYKFELNGHGFTVSPSTTITETALIMFGRATPLNCYINFHHIKFTMGTIGGTCNSFFYLSLGATSDINVSFHHNFINGAGFGSTSPLVYLDGSFYATGEQKFYCYQNIVINAYQYAIRWTTRNPDNTIVEYNTIYNGGFYGLTSSVGYYEESQSYNNASFDNISDDFVSVTNVNVSRCASSDATGWEEAYRNLVASEQFKSLDENDVNFLVPSISGVLRRNGIAPRIAENTTYYDGTVITSPYSIGALRALTVTSILTNAENKMKTLIESMSKSENYNFDWGTANEPDSAKQDAEITAQIYLTSEENVDDENSVGSQVYANSVFYDIIIPTTSSAWMDNPNFDINSYHNGALDDLKKLFGINYNLGGIVNSIMYQGMKRETLKNGDVLTPGRLITRWRIDYIQDRENPTEGAC